MTTYSADNFAHGSYGDLSGVVFYGPPVNGFWEDRLAVSDRFIDPLFSAVVDRSIAAGAAALPRIVADWKEIKGWADAAGAQELSGANAWELIVALTGLAESDVAPHVAGVTAAECVRCGTAIAAFLRDRIERRQAVYIEND